MPEVTFTLRAIEGSGRQFSEHLAISFGKMAKVAEAAREGDISDRRVFIRTVEHVFSMLQTSMMAPTSQGDGPSTTIR
jgi:hypothetical protein